MKKVLKSFLIIFSVLIFSVVIYIIYVTTQYYRIEDYQTLSINNISKELENKEFTITSYNIGFGAYDREYSFFMDSGEMLDGKEVNGKYAKGSSKKHTIQNTVGAISLISDINPDFCFFQEVDKKASRSYKVNQYQMLQNANTDMASIYSSNFHSAYLLYPFNDPIGKTESGLVTLSKYNVTSSIRRSFPVDNSFINKFFDLDRSFVISRIKVSGTKDLVLINVHMSAYDEGGRIRQKQVMMLNEILELEKDNYVVCGGDFNHCLINDVNKFPTEQKLPEWVYLFNNEDIPSTYKIISDNKNPTCRSSEIPYTKGINYTTVLDGFIVSNNITVNSVENIVKFNSKDVEFMYSDHNPVVMKFTLN